MKNGIRRRLQGRTSCWILGGLGCLGLIVMAFVGVYLLGRAIQQSGFGQMVKTASEAEQKFKPRLSALYEAIRRYEQDNNGKYPPSLKSLIPKYLTEEAISPVVLSDGTKYEFVYRPPKPNDPPDTVILEHKPPVKLVFSLAGETAETHVTYQVRKDGTIRDKTESVSTSGRQTQQKGAGGQ